MFMLMLRCGLRVEEVANLNLGVIDVKRRTILVEDGKGGKDRVVYLSHDALQSLAAYMRVRPASRARRIFLVQKGPYKGQPISIRGIQWRMEYYARQAKLKVSCHHLRHTMATQLLNADADLCTIQDLLGHSQCENHTTILPDIKSEGAERLLQCHGGDQATNGWQPNNP